MRKFVLSLVIASSSLLASALTHAERFPGLSVFLDELHQQHGFDRAELAALFADSVVLDKVLERISKPAEALPWHRYRKIFLTPARTDEGVRFVAEHTALLQRAEQTYGVSRYIIAAILGVETRYGTHKGRHRILDSLATLAFHYPKRASFFRRELAEFLLLGREEGLDVRQLHGSYAGAMGYPQFISSSYRAYAVDFDNDGRRDLLADIADAIGSVANYFVRHGWQSGRPVALPLAADKAGDTAPFGTDPRTRSTAVELASAGWQLPAGLVATEPVAPLLFEAEHGNDYWLGLKNFYVITRYNHSPLYALAVYQLAEAIRHASTVRG